ncbi:BolA/IbaG family iron-sulfur metabolism protein [Enterobacteriaceae endosymbiont of Donacia cincticornis]|uniref:BolA/IbaG family iron-sulfur metabolism protein n=1 Tax=Enterobacteriaceae endosymbiont of Donacia cincticornis TaxID=2675773 RepID=UPI001449AE80|nr:BolA family protein [Enterobacteriaceae endosymbiont of Donacia cincticornis]QJC36099.1 BolA/IbaG family iron-sulfur metabolism protein [Enterobacteriaceae endosymbiont of Donacia cincticornis]
MIIEKIKNKIIFQLKPIYLKIKDNNLSKKKKVINHLEIIIVSNNFIKQSLVNRHKLIYRIIGNKINNIHSLSLYTYTLSEWEEIKKNKIL